MQEELECLRARKVELTRGLSIIKKGLGNFSDFLDLRGTVGRLEAEITSLRTTIEIFPPSHADLLKVAGPRCQHILAIVQLCLTF